MSTPRSGVTLVAGLGYGDEGKGTIVDRLVRDRSAELVVRYNGGAQAAHNVVTGDGGRHHTFAQLGSGTFAGARTLLSRFVLVNPIALVAEARALEDKGVDAPLARVAIDGDALVTTPYHVAMNRLREMARSRRHGSCGMGIGETMEDALAAADPAGVLRVRDLGDRAVTREKLAALRERKIRQLGGFLDTVPAGELATRELSILDDPSLIDDTTEAFHALSRQVATVGPEHLASALARGAHVVFEGAQGVLLDQDFGFQPHTTWTDITFTNAWTLLREVGYGGPALRLGVARAYATRHGAGPFVTEDRAFDRLSSHDHNRRGPWQGSFRSGALDEVALRYAVAVTNLDRLALLGDRVPVAIAYEAEDGTRLDAIPLRRPAVYAAQEEVTRRLLAARPVLERVAVDDVHGALAYGERVARVAGAPLAIASFGPTAEEKLVLAEPKQVSFQSYLPQVCGGPRGERLNLPARSVTAPGPGALVR
jgi:adenylosuccinate synthase